MTDRPALPAAALAIYHLHPTRYTRVVLRSILRVCCAAKDTSSWDENADLLDVIQYAYVTRLAYIASSLPSGVIWPVSCSHIRHPSQHLERVIWNQIRAFLFVHLASIMNPAVGKTPVI